MTKCPDCNATLPDGAVHCQFCGAALAPTGGASRSGGRPAAGRAHSSSLQDRGEYAWAWWIYYGVSAWWILNGGYAIFLSVTQSGGLLGIISLLIGLFTALVGLGLIFRVEAARGIVNVLCFIQILEGCFGLGVGFLLSGFIGIWGIIGMLMSILRIVFAVLMIFAIGETESRGPNF